MPVTTIDSVTGITTSDFRVEVRKAAAVIVGGSTTAAWTAGATPTESETLPPRTNLPTVLIYYFILFFVM
jgi:hypothetical protein